MDKPEKTVLSQIRIINYGLMDWLIESWLYNQLKTIILFLLKLLKGLQE